MVALVQLTKPTETNPNTRGILFMLLTAVIQAFIAIAVRTTSPQVAVHLQLIAYYCVPLIFIGPFALANFEETIKTKKLSLHLLRGLFAYSSVYCFFYVIKHLPLGISTTLFNSIPLFVPVIANLVLKEKLSGKNYAGLLLALMGVLFILNPKFDGFSSKTVLIGLSSAILMACGSVLLRMLAVAKEPLSRIVFYQYLSCSCFTLLGITASQALNLPLKEISLSNINWAIIGVLILLGCLSWMAQLTFSKASYLLPASKLAPFFYASVPISSLLGYVFWNQKISLVACLGSIFVFLGLYVCALQRIQVKPNPLIKI